MHEKPMSRVSADPGRVLPWLDAAVAALSPSEPALAQRVRAVVSEAVAALCAEGPEETYEPVDRVNEADGIKVDAGQGRVWVDGVETPLRPRLVRLADLFVGNPGRALRREKLTAAAFGTTHVAPGVLDAAVAELRRAIRRARSDADRSHGIDTVYNVGYRFATRTAPPPADLVARRRDILRAADVIVDMDAWQTWQGERELALQFQAFKLLEIGVRRAGLVVTYEMVEQHAAIPRTHKEPLRQLRTALGDDDEQPLYIDTVKHVGVRFVTDEEFEERRRGRPRADAAAVASHGEVMPAATGDEEGQIS